MSDNLPAANENLPIESIHGPPDLFTGLNLDRYQRRFLVALAECGLSPVAAQRKCKIPRQYHNMWLKNCADYLIAYDFIEKAVVSESDAEVHQRGITGYKRQLTHQGRLTGDKVTSYSDLLAIAWMRAHDKRYRDQSVNNDVGPVAVCIKLGSDREISIGDVPKQVVGKVVGKPE